MIYFRAPRIIIREIIGDHLVATYTEELFLVNKSCYIIVSNKDDKDFLKFLLGVLNSSLIGFYVQNLCDKSKQKLFPLITMGTLKKIPIPTKNLVLQGKIVSMVEKVLNDYDSFGENKIDFLVYHLYGLTYDEVLIVDPDTPITREEYEAYKGE